MAPTPSPEDPRVGLPAVDLRLVAPESRYEIHDGKIEYVPPSDEPHGAYSAQPDHSFRSHPIAIPVDLIEIGAKRRGNQ